MAGTAKTRTTTRAKSAPKANAPKANVPKANVPKASAPKARVERAGGISAEAVKKATGCDWDSWFEWLDRKGAVDRSHREIAALVATELENSDWWSQMVSVAYEQARGKRVPHQKTDGFSVSASKTLEVSAHDVFQWMANAAKRKRWLPIGIEITRATAPKSIRARGPGEERIDVNITSKGDAKCSIACEHSRLESQAAVESTRATWKTALEKLAKLVK